MSSAKKTPNLKLHSWAATDPVLRDDFNENFTKIDTAVGAINKAYGTGNVYSGSYTGTGAASHSLTFPKRPVFLAICAANRSITNIAIVAEGETINGIITRDTISISGTTLTLTNSNPDKSSNNTEGKVFYYVALA